MMEPYLDDSCPRCGNLSGGGIHTQCPWECLDCGYVDVHENGDCKQCKIESLFYDMDYEEQDMMIDIVKTELKKREQARNKKRGNNDG